MYFICNSFILRFISICLVLGFIERAVPRAVSDNSIYANDVLDDAGSNMFLDESSLTSQFPDSFATGDNFVADNSPTDDLLTDKLPTDNLVADNLDVADAQSCAQPSNKLGARQSCLNSDATGSSIYTPADERLLTQEEVDEYWCLGNVNTGIPVCSVEEYKEGDVKIRYDSLQSTMS